MKVKEDATFSSTDSSSSSDPILDFLVDGINVCSIDDEEVGSDGNGNVSGNDDCCDDEDDDE